MARTLGEKTTTPSPSNVPPPSGAESWKQVGGTQQPQRLPLQIGATFISDTERKVLEQLNLKDGDKVPADLAQRMDALAREQGSLQSIADAETQEALAEAFPVDPSTPPLQIKPPIPFEQLSTAKQAELRRSLEDFNKHAYLLEGGRAGEMPPELAKSMAAAANAPAVKISSRDAPPRQSAQPQPATASTTTAEAAPNEATTPSHLCPWCGWDQAKLSDEKLSETDKLDYIAATASGQRFRKSYTLLRGKVTLVMRGLTAAETDLVRQQIIYDTISDAKGDQIRLQSDYAGDVVLYLACLSLESASFAGGGDGDITIKPLAEFDLPEQYAVKAPDTKVKGYTRMVVEEVLKTEAIKQMVIQTYTFFDYTARHLLRSAPDPNF